ncbi:hypothetical protein AVEN_3637-1 [Araneus ventricosus]|uniref:Uncharacterized protein n=1 Tax=Araneus ventricosus TaxID=182803 RepID=A0A4Y2TM63_ARAVE|nr:hypothetical protein AVEN_3637-1 [Araneus ventricosus]
MAKDIFFVSVGCLHLGYTAVKVYEAFNGELPAISLVTGYVKNVFKTDETETSKPTGRDLDVKREDDLRLDITNSMISDINEHDFDEKLIAGSFIILFGLLTVLDIFFLEDLTRFTCLQ